MAYRGGQYSFRDLKKIHKNINREHSNIEFLKDCKYFGIIPKFLKIHNTFLNKEFKRDLIDFERKILNKVIRRKYGSINLWNYTLNDIRTNIINWESEEILKDYELRITQYTTIEREIRKTRHNKKLKFWINKYNIDFRKYNHRNEIPYINLSSFKPTDTQDKLLKLGPKHIIDQPINIRHSIAAIENAIETLPETGKTECRAIAAKELKKKIKDNKNNLFEFNLLKEIRNNNDIKCIRTDKTGKMAILNSLKYDNLIQKAIDKLNVTILTSDPNNKLIRQVDLIIKEKHWPNGHIPKKNQAPNTPRIFGTLKDHKDPVTIRPIVNKAEGPTYFLEKYMKDVYHKLLPSSTSSLNSTMDFIDKIRNFAIKESDTMVSFDVKDMFPSIDTVEISAIINEELKNQYKNETDTSDLLYRASNLILNSSFFQYKNKFYKQENGLPMGSPISSVLAELKMRRLENCIIQEQRRFIKFWCRYVDDIFAVITDIEPLNLLDVLNSYDNNIKFTIESELNGKLNFLDVLLIRNHNEQKLDTTVYRKPTSNPYIVNSNSITPYNYKMSVLTSYINRAINICSDNTYLTEEIDKINNTATQAGYGRNIVKELYKKRIKDLEHIPNAQKSKRKHTFTTSIPYDKGVGISIKNAAKKYNFHIPIKPNPSIMQIIKNDRDKIDPKETAGIYKINYVDKNNKCGAYIGVTERKIRTRVHEHFNDIKNNRQKAAITKLDNLKDTIIDFNNPVKLSDYINHGYAYKRESVEILAEKNSCNTMDHSTLPRLWKNWFSNESRRSNVQKDLSLPDDATDSGEKLR